MKTSGNGGTPEHPDPKAAEATDATETAETTQTADATRSAEATGAPVPAGTTYTTDATGTAGATDTTHAPKAAHPTGPPEPADAADAPACLPGRRYEPDLRRMTRINLRPIASPMPLGFYAVAIASVVVGCLQLGVLGSEARQAVGLVILPAFVLQLVVAILAFGARDVLAASLMACFSGMWLANSLVLSLDPPAGTRVLGLLNAMFSLFALMMASVAARKRALWLVLCVAVPRFAIAAVHNLTGRAAWLGTLSGAFGLLLAAVAMYTAFALMLEDMRGVRVLPIGRTGPAHTAVEGDLTVQLRDIERQAGVRRTL
ncbi:GPR1/FUN34/YaaH family transporter [Streptomyces mobaraensis]|uniref:acetate uptake transporter family protein n=1 Tax=Streptomyces mobaraensis TaxID=35621 RepID=UPI003331EDB9